MAVSKGKTSKMASPNLAKMSLKDLMDLQEDVEKAIAIARERERHEVLAKMQELASSAGFSINDLVGGRGRGKAKGSTSVAKYANPDNRAETWTGRGRKPNWLVAKLGKGASLEDFTI